MLPEGCRTICIEVKEEKKSYFPILVKLSCGKYLVITKPENLPEGISFTVIQTDIEIK